MQADPLFLDRIDEREAVDSLVDSARQGGSGALVIQGEAGMGKTALLEYAVASSDLRLARISGVEAEQEFGFAALHRLLLPFLGDLEDLPEPQRTALRAAFGLLDRTPPDRFMVGLAALSLLAVESSASGLLCVVDDAQWIDVESLRTLAFVGRRIRAEGIVLLFGLRTPFGVSRDLAGIRSIELGGLPAEPAGDLLRHAAGRSLAAGVTRRIVTEMEGCPLALWELGKELADTDSSSRSPIQEPLAISRRLEDHFFEQVSSLSEETRLFLLVAASETSGDRALVRRVTFDLGGSQGAETEAYRRRLLVPGAEIRFRHPLIRSAVYARADPDQRRIVHRTLADDMDKAAHPDRWAHHVVLGAVGPNGLLAAELEATSQLARTRGGYSAEMTLLVQAADLSDTVEARSLRLLRAAGAATSAGSHSYAAELLDLAEPHLSEPKAAAEALHLRGQLSIGLSHPAKAPALLLTAARSFLPLSGERAREILLEAFEAHSISGQFTLEIEPSEIASVAREAQAGAELRSLQDSLLYGTAAFFDGDLPLAYEHYRRALDLVRNGEVAPDQAVDRCTFGLITADEMFDDRSYRVWIEGTDAQARKSGALLPLLFNLFAQVHNDVRVGRLDVATGRYAEALDVAAAIGLPAGYYRPLDCIVRAWAGDEEGTRSAAAALIRLAGAIGVGAVVNQAHGALAVLHLGAGRYSDALEEAEYVRAQNAVGYPAQILPLVVEASVRSGQTANAEAALATLESRARMSGSPWGLGLLASSAALLVSSTEAEALFEEAIEHLEQTTVATDLAHTRLLYGEWLRREKRRIDARVQLRLAYHHFTKMAAAGFARRAENELRATGERARPRSVEHATDLTPQERRIAELASEGLSNQEIASQLFISSATVDYHLRKVFRKLDVGSRNRLGKALRARDFDR